MEAKPEQRDEPIQLGLHHQLGSRPKPPEPPEPPPRKCNCAICMGLYYTGCSE